VYGRQSLIIDRQTSIKSGSNLASAARNQSDWLANVRRMDVANLSLGRDGPEVSFMVESDCKRTRFVNLQTACSILDLSKMVVVRAQYNFARLYAPENYANLYT